MSDHNKSPATSDRPAPGLDVSTGYRLLRVTKEYKLTSKCPYCGGGLTMSINGSELEKDGSGWSASELDINCDTEPDIDGPKWPGWWEDHSHDYCNKWHDLHERVVRTLKRTHRVIHDNVPDQPRGKPAPQAEVTPARVGL